MIEIFHILGKIFLVSLYVSGGIMFILLLKLFVKNTIKK